jgi:hypothetical protein
MPLERKMDAFGRPNSGGKGIIFNYFPEYINISETKKTSILIIVIHLTFWSLWWCTWLNENVVVK